MELRISDWDSFWEGKNSYYKIIKQVFIRKVLNG